VGVLRTEIALPEPQRLALVRERFVHPAELVEADRDRVMPDRDVVVVRLLPECQCPQRELPRLLGPSLLKLDIRLEVAEDRLGGRISVTALHGSVGLRRPPLRL